jgi:hypothetical protein
VPIPEVKMESGSKTSSVEKMAFEGGVP